MSDKQCSVKVWSNSRWPSSRNCANTAVVEQDGKWYCKIHSPEYITEKNRKRDEKWEAKRKALHINYAAPEMYRCLKELINRDNIGSIRLPTQASDLMKQVIAKAEGK